jgi:hypothetical protein
MPSIKLDRALIKLPPALLDALERGCLAPVRGRPSNTRPSPVAAKAYLSGAAPPLTATAPPFLDIICHQRPPSRIDIAPHTLRAAPLPIYIGVF